MGLCPNGPYSSSSAARRQKLPNFQMTTIWLQSTCVLGLFSGRVHPTTPPTHTFRQHLRNCVESRFRTSFGCHTAPGPPLIAFLLHLRSSNELCPHGLYSSSGALQRQKLPNFRMTAVWLQRTCVLGLFFGRVLTATPPHPHLPQALAELCGKPFSSEFGLPLLRLCPRCVHNTNAQRAN